MLNNVKNILLVLSFVLVNGFGATYNCDDAGWSNAKNATFTEDEATIGNVVRQTHGPSAPVSIVPMGGDEYHVQNINIKFWTSTNSGIKRISKIHIGTGVKLSKNDNDPTNDGLPTKFNEVRTHVGELSALEEIIIDGRADWVGATIDTVLFYELQDASVEFKFLGKKYKHSYILELGGLTLLKYLEIENTNLSLVSETLNSMKVLDEVYLNNNRITYVGIKSPDDAVTPALPCRKLKVVDLRNNYFTNNDFEYLEVDTFYIADNYLKNFPLFNLKNAVSTKLDASYNLISNYSSRGLYGNTDTLLLNNNIVAFFSLIAAKNFEKYIDLRDNYIKYIYPSGETLPTGQVVKLDGNVFCNIKEIAEMDLLEGLDPITFHNDLITPERDWLNDANPRCGEELLDLKISSNCLQGTTTPSGVIKAYSNTDYDIEAEVLPGEPYEFSHWEIIHPDPNVTPETELPHIDDVFSEKTKVRISKDSEIKAVFKKVGTHTVSVSKKGDNDQALVFPKGTFNFNDGRYFAPYYFLNNQSPYLFKQWLLKTGSTENPITFPSRVTADMEIIAEFIHDPTSFVELSIDNPAEISYVTDLSRDYNNETAGVIDWNVPFYLPPNTEFSLTTTLAPGYILDRWTLSGVQLVSEVGNVATFRVDNVTLPATASIVPVVLPMFHIYLGPSQSITDHCYHGESQDVNVEMVVLTNYDNVLYGIIALKEDDPFEQDLTLFIDHIAAPAGDVVDGYDKKYVINYNRNSIPSTAISNMFFYTWDGSKWIFGGDDENNGVPGPDLQFNVNAITGTQLLPQDLTASTCNYAFVENSLYEFRITLPSSSSSIKWKLQGETCEFDALPLTYNLLTNNSAPRLSVDGDVADWGFINGSACP
ncbi:MAG: hypothetical protein OCC49_01105 [Fibrobacterales bacterium]